MIHHPDDTRALAPRVITLGTAGGPRWWEGRAGIATAIEVGDAVYLVDCGQGVGRQLARAGIRIPRLRAIFLTHLHSDHTIDLASLAVFGVPTITDPAQRPIRVIGPGNRGMLPPTSPRAIRTPQPAFPDDPTPGTASMVDHLLRAYATDLNDRILDSLRPSPVRYFVGEDVVIPAWTGYHPNDNPIPEGMEPFEIYADENLTVTATLVRHPPIAPAFAFRFETAGGSVTISGDTAPSENLVRLARDTDLLLHEAIDFDQVAQAYRFEPPEVAQACIDHHHKSHTSPTQAGEIATRARAKALALHHLVPADTHPAVWQEARATFAGPLHVPDDLDVLTLAADPGIAEPTPIPSLLNVR